MAHLLLSYDNDTTAFVDLGRVQGKSNYEVAVDNGFVGTEDDWLKSLTAQSMGSKIVMSKPRIEDDDISTGVWYYWQDNKEGTTDTAYKYRLDIPAMQDLEHGKYCFYYNLKWFTSEPTQDVPALTDKDTYKYYLIMNLADVSYDIIKETIADGTTTVIEHVQGASQTTRPGSEYTEIPSSGLQSLGVQCQTLYIGSTKETSSEVTIRTGTDVRGFVESGTFNSIIGSLGDLLTTDISSIVNAINEVFTNLNTTKEYLDEHTNNSDVHLSTTDKEKWNKVDEKVDTTDFNIHTGDTTIHITTDERTKWNKVDNKVNKTDIVDNLTSTDTDKPLSANQGKVLKDEVDLKANDDEVVKKTSLVTTIDSSSTHTQVPSAKSVYDNTLMLELPEVNSDYNIDITRKYIMTHVNPTENGDHGTYPTEVKWGALIQLPVGNYRSQILISMQGMYYRIMKSGIWQPWYKVNATEVRDTTTYPKETT